MRNTHVYTLLLGNGIELGWFAGRGEFDLDLFDLQQSLKSGSYSVRRTLVTRTIVTCA